MGDSSSGLSKGNVASGASLASLGLSAFGKIEAGYGTQAGYEFKAAQAERSAEFGRVQAGLTDTVMRERLNTTLSNIDVIRAAAKADPGSIETGFIEDYSSKISDRQRTAALLSIKSQVQEDEASAQYLHALGEDALLRGETNAALKIPAAALAGMGKG